MDLKIGDKVDLIVVRQGKIGFTVLVNGEFEGLLYKSELFQRVMEGQKLVGYIKKIRSDEKLDLSLQKIGFKSTIVKNEIKILKALKEGGGFLALHDKSDPDTIKYQLGMSKKAFKNALGGLFRQKLVRIEKDGVHLAQLLS